MSISNIVSLFICRLDKLTGYSSITKKLLEVTKSLNLSSSTFIKTYDFSMLHTTIYDLYEYIYILLLLEIRSKLAE